MKYALWIVQVLLALAFLAAGSMKILTPYESLLESLPWVEVFSAIPWVITIIGIIEVLGAIGLILPALTRILPLLTPLAGAGLALTMVGAAILHASRGEWGNIVPNTVLLLLASFVVYGRYKLLPITSRSEVSA